MPKTITITIPDDRLKVFEHEVADIEQWVRDALEGRYQYTINVLADEARRVLEADPAVTTMPAKPAALIAEYLKRPDYKNRVQRDAEEEAKRKAKV